MMNPNPRLGVFLNVHNATIRLVNCLTRPVFAGGRVPVGGWRLRGLRSFVRTWPRARLLRYWPHFGLHAATEFERLLTQHHPELLPQWHPASAEFTVLLKYPDDDSPTGCATWCDTVKARNGSEAVTLAQLQAGLPNRITPADMLPISVFAGRHRDLINEWVAAQSQS